ncbi:MAG: type 1 glutamine amidotransferase [Actinomycetota bacterium]|nr:type 1 glutamine amidotransferase [Actinomycetota bacterium]
MADKTLKGRTVAVLAADGFEKVELTTPVRALRRAGATVEIVSIAGGRIRGLNMHEPAKRVGVDRVLAEANAARYDALVIPGGFISPDLLRQSAEARAFVRDFDQARKPIATLCHGPWLLASAGLLRGRTVTSWPGIRDDMVNGGAVWLDRDVVRDGNWVTSRGPQDLPTFVPVMRDLFTETAPASRSARAPAQSDPQATKPPKTVVGAVRWMPKPRSLVVLGVVAATAARRRLRDVSGRRRTGRLSGLVHQI